MKLIPPEKFNIQITANDDGTWNMDYEEWFHDANLVARTAEMLRNMPKLDVVTFSQPDKHTLRFEYRHALMENVAGHITGEFLSWTTLGQMSLADLLGSAIALGNMPEDR